MCNENVRNNLKWLSHFLQNAALIMNTKGKDISCSTVIFWALSAPWEGVPEVGTLLGSRMYYNLNWSSRSEAEWGWKRESVHRKRYKSLVASWPPYKLQLDLANSNSVMSNTPLFRTWNHFPQISPSVIYYRLFWTPTISNNISFPLRVRSSGVQLYFIHTTALLFDSIHFYVPVSLSAV